MQSCGVPDDHEQSSKVLASRVRLAKTDAATACGGSYRELPAVFPPQAVSDDDYHETYPVASGLSARNRLKPVSGCLRCKRGRSWIRPWLQPWITKSWVNRLCRKRADCGSRI